MIDNANSPVEEHTPLTGLTKIKERAASALFAGFLSLIILLASPYLISVVFYYIIRERRFERSIRKAGRFLVWDEVVDRLAQSKGTLLFEVTYSGMERVWWCENDLIGDAPCELSNAIPDSHACRKSDQSIFALECAGRYLNAVRGEGYLTRPPKKIKELWFDTWDLKEHGQEKWVRTINAVTIVVWALRTQCVADIAIGEPATVLSGGVVNNRISEYKIGVVVRSEIKDAGS
ncbi:MAG: hypothetical protein ACE37H_09910 [Phycisphaeraceae bacterium]